MPYNLQMGEVYSESYQISEIKLFAKLVKLFSERTPSLIFGGALNTPLNCIYCPCSHIYLLPQYITC